MSVTDGVRTSSHLTWVECRGVGLMIASHSTDGVLTCLGVGSPLILRKTHNESRWAWGDAEMVYLNSAHVIVFWPANEKEAG